MLLEIRTDRDRALHGLCWDSVGNSVGFYLRFEKPLVLGMCGLSELCSGSAMDEYSREIGLMRDGRSNASLVVFVSFLFAFRFRGTRLSGVRGGKMARTEVVRCLCSCSC